MKVAFVLLALAACGDSGGGDGSAPDADGTHPLAIASAVDIGLQPLPPHGVGRDGGMSGTIGGRVLWTFGDTFLDRPNTIDGSTVLSATAGWSSVEDPLALAHALEGDEPAQLIPYTAEEITANTADALNGYALWPDRVIDIGEPTAVVMFERIKRDHGSSFSGIGVGTARIAPDAPTATRAPALLFGPDETGYLPTALLDGYVYAFGCEKRGPLDFACKLARVVPASIEDRAAYEFWTGTAWSADVALAAYVISNTSVPPSISWNAHLGAYLAVSCQLLSSTVELRTAPAVTGPWGHSQTIHASADGASGIYAPVNDDAYNYLCVEHPELASSDGSQIVVGYSRPTTTFRGDVRLARITLE